MQHYTTLVNPHHTRCDKKLDCLTGEDEQGCHLHCSVDEFVCRDRGCVKQTKVPPGTNRVLSHFYPTVKENRILLILILVYYFLYDCMIISQVCDSVPDCADGSDEMEHCHCYTRGQFACRWGTQHPHISPNSLIP